MELKKENKLDFQLIKAGSLIKILALQMFDKNNVEIMPEQFSILLTLADYGDLYQREIGQITLKDRPNINRIIKILEAKGLVTRTKEASGRQVSKVHLTERGLKTVEKNLPIFLQVNDLIKSAIPENEIETFTAHLKNITEEIKSHVKMQL